MNKPMYTNWKQEQNPEVRHQLLSCIPVKHAYEFVKHGQWDFKSFQLWVDAQILETKIDAAQ